MPKTYQIGEDLYQEAPETAVMASKWLTDAWEALGRPETPLSDAGTKLLSMIIVTWEELYPQEARQWYEDRKTYKVNELSAREQIHQRTGRSLASYPFPVFQMMKKVFPDFSPTERKNCLKLIAKFPIFKFANKA